MSRRTYTHFTIQYIHILCYIHYTVYSDDTSKLDNTKSDRTIVHFVVYCSIYEMWGGNLLFSIDDMNKIYIFVFKMVIIDIKFPYLFRDLKFPKSFFL